MIIFDIWTVCYLTPSTVSSRNGLDRKGASKAIVVTFHSETVIYLIDAILKRTKIREEFLELFNGFLFLEPFVRKMRPERLK